LLLDDPNNEEYRGIYDSLAEVRSLWPLPAGSPAAVLEEERLFNCCGAGDRADKRPAGRGGGEGAGAIQ
jgi:hypothetical protein